MTDQESNPSQPLQDAAKARKKLYKKSLNLPKTSFPMRANLGQNEPQSQKRWQKNDLYKRVLSAREGCESYWFHDGPPYANGEIHVGHLLNKVLKDLVVRSRNMAGKHCPYIPGWDCHGLPIEHKVMLGLTESGKAEKLNGLEEDVRRMAIRRECQRYAERFVKIQAEQMTRLMTLADYENPYKTMSSGYEAKVLEVFADLVDQGLVYRDLKPVHWSIANETALAEAELEYQDREDPSIYVWFEASDSEKVAEIFGVDLGKGTSAHFMIWTTTPWTLPANLLIAVHERFEYSLVELNGKTGILAKEMLERVAKKTGSEPTILGTVAGKELIGLGYRHPFVTPGEMQKNAYRIVSADYVTLEDGTGLVHTAPGHGADDYQTGLREDVAVYCPVMEDGCYDNTVPHDLRGMSIWQANPQLIEQLRTSGHLYFTHQFVHSYPHDWRSKTPVIFRATEQWFISVDQKTRDFEVSLRDAALSATEKEIRFVPEWGRNRMRGMLESRPDWCISRQRSWGLPIPAFRLPDGSVFLTSESVRAVAQAFSRDGSDAWFEKEPKDLLADWQPSSDQEAPEALRSGEVDVSQLRKLYDIFDVWFESGSSWNSVMRARNQGYPVDLYLEGSDQHRGWFQSSLLPALGATGKAPFKTVLTHGFMVDRDGRKMSKSGGNALDVKDLLVDYGADVCRWWVSQLPFENDIKVDIEFFDTCGEAYRKIRNTLRFLLSNLDDFDPAQAVATEAIPGTSIDAWALEQTSRLAHEVDRCFESFDFRKANLALFDFCNDTMSSVYLDAVKDRLYCDVPDSTRRRLTQSVLYQITSALCRLLAPILPHTADEAWRALHRVDDPDTTVHTELFPVLDYEADAGWLTVTKVRDEVLKAIELAKAEGIENPLDAGVQVADPEGILAAFTAELPDVFGVSRVELVDRAALADTAGGPNVIDLRDQPRCERSWRRDETVKERSDGGFLSERDAQAVGLA